MEEKLTLGDLFNETDKLKNSKEITLYNFAHLLRYGHSKGTVYFYANFLYGLYKKRNEKQYKEIFDNGSLITDRKKLYEFFKDFENKYDIKLFSGALHFPRDESRKIEDKDGYQLIPLKGTIESVLGEEYWNGCLIEELVECEDMMCINGMAKALNTNAGIHLKESKIVFEPETVECFLDKIKPWEEIITEYSKNAETTDRCNILGSIDGRWENYKLALGIIGGDKKLAYKRKLSRIFNKKKN
jgi:hypothetical protein